MPTHLDLCSGIGGFALAARWAGYRTVGFCEIDPFCTKVLAKNFPGVPIHDDIKSLAAETVRGWLAGDRPDEGRPADDADERHELAAGEVRPGRDGAGGPGGGGPLDLLTAGYPCQPFSHAGRRLGAADDRHLWPAIARLVADLRPRWCLFENVAGHVSLGLDDVLADLEGQGYAWWAAVIPACAVNAPHRRDRVWIVAALADADGAGREPRPGEWIQQVDLRLSDSAQPRGRDVAHSADGGPRCRTASWQGGQPALGSEAATDPDAPGLSNGSAGGFAGLGRGPDGATADGCGRAVREAERRLGQLPHGVSPWLDRPERSWGPDWEDGVPRTVDGKQADRVSRLKALGNSIVPQVAYEIMRAIRAADAA